MTSQVAFDLVEKEYILRRLHSIECNCFLKHRINWKHIHNSEIFLHPAVKFPEEDPRQIPQYKISHLSAAGRSIHSLFSWLRLWSCGFHLF
jgi:hypothetical protein